MGLFKLEQHGFIVKHFNEPDNGSLHVRLEHYPEFELVALVQRSQLQPYYYWLELKRVPHKKAHPVSTTYESPSFDSVEQLLNYHTAV